MRYNIVRRVLMAVPLLAISGAAFAQSGSVGRNAAVASVPLVQTPADRVQSVRLSGDYFMVQALAISAAAANGAFDEIYAKAAPLMKAAQGQQAFVTQLRNSLTGNGAAVSRDWLSIARHIVPASPAPAPGAPPPGEYVTVVLALETEAQGGRTETISFHRDSDNQWRLCGFVVAAFSAPSPTALPKK